ncbi:MAG: hypothetical protein GX076_08795 [Clostridiales bacterium]|nr:hypothetical protein [Clostridiales bacterium]
MAALRRVIKLVKGKQVTDGAGVNLVRVFGRDDTEDFDPFLMLDAFDSQNPADYIKGFPWHPHRGIETITYLIKGHIEHSDSLGNKGDIYDGECQWMTAGSGIIHQEMPKPKPHMLGAQLWLNLPAKDKMTKPAYGDIKAGSIPVVDEGGAKVHVIAGEYLGNKGAFEGKYVKATYLDVELFAGQEWSFTDDPENTLFIYIFSGKANFDPEDPDELIEERQAVLFGKGEKLWVKAVGQDMRFILLSGKALKEPVAWRGPIVMNTKEELDIAFKELNNNTFIKDNGIRSSEKMDKIKIVGLTGSLREKSYNKAVLNAVKELVPDNVDYEVIDLSDIPFYNEDVEKKGLPDSVANLKKKLFEADGVLVSTPEYNFSIPPVLKNALDWVSRGSELPLYGKPIAIMSASPSMLGGARVQYHLRQVCVSLNLIPVNKPEVFISNADKKFDENGVLVDEMTKRVIKDLINALIDKINELK